MRTGYPICCVIAIAVAIAAAACSGGEAMQSTPSSGRGGPPSAQAVPVATAVVEEKAMPLDIGVIGSVEPTSTVSVRAQITGELTAVTFREGDDVQKGQELFRLDRRPLEGVLQQAQANLERDMAQAANAKAQAQRYLDLAARGIATKEQVDTTRTSAVALDATVEADKAAV